MIIKNGYIFTESGSFQKGQILIKENIIEKIELSDVTETTDENVDENMFDAGGMYVLPGFVDIHFHGASGADFCDAADDTFAILEEYQMKNGVTTVFPATMTLAESTLQNICEATGEFVKNSSMGVIAGITMEGPFISDGKKGAQNALYIRKPDVDFFQRIQKASQNLIRQVAVAPEEDTGLEFISEVSKEVIVSLAHSVSDYETAKKAFMSGASHVTHLFNGMHPFSHREPGIVGAAYDDQNVYVELICDGVHIHPSMVRAMFQLFGAKRICMISDSMRAAGMPDGEYSLGGQKVFKNGNRATLEDGTIAGSVCNLYECFKKAVKEMQIPLEEAVLSCTKTPAKSLGVDDTCGILKEGRNADILILDENLDIKYVIKCGKIIVNR